MSDTTTTRNSVNDAKISVRELSDLMVQRVPLVAQLGLVVDAVGAGDTVVRVPYRGDFVRPGGTVAGPVMMALADFAMYAVVMSLIGPDEMAVTTNLNINFLRRPAPGDVTAHGKILQLGKHLAVIDVEIHGDDAKELVAHATGTYSIPPRD